MAGDYPITRVGDLADSISETHKMEKEHLWPVPFEDSRRRDKQVVSVLAIRLFGSGGPGRSRPGAARICASVPSKSVPQPIKRVSGSTDAWLWCLT